MSQSDILINSLGPVRYFLALAFEGNREQIREVDRYPFFGGKNLELLDEVSELCEGNCSELRRSATKLGIELEEELGTIGNFIDNERDGRRRKEVIKDFLDRSDLLLDLYEKLRSRTDKGFIEDLGDQGDGYFDFLDRLISGEKKKNNILKRVVRRLTFLPSEKEILG